MDCICSWLREPGSVLSFVNLQHHERDSRNCIDKFPQKDTGDSYTFVSPRRGKKEINKRSLESWHLEAGVT